MEPSISVIMPVYKVEAFVGKAIDSVLQQTRGDFELLIVDDGSPDRSGEICDQYARQDSRIRVFHKENGGAPSARNYAMERAIGKYYYFMDSDDWIESRMFQDLLELAEKHQAQLVISGFYIDTYYSDREYLSETKTYRSVAYASQIEFRRDSYQLFDRNLLYTPWNKLFLKDYIDSQGIKFKQTFWDDFPFNLDVVRNVERVVVTDRCYYHFLRARAESETSKYREGVYEKRETEHNWLEELYSYWGVNSPEIEEMLARRYVERLIGCIENVSNPSCKLGKKEKKAQIHQMISSQRCQTNLQKGQPKSAYMKLMWVPLKLKSPGLSYAEGRFIAWVKSRNTKVFSQLKANR